MLKSCSLFYTPDTVTIVKPEDETLWKKQSSLHSRNLYHQENRIGIIELRIAFLEASLKAKELVNTVSARDMQIIIRDIEVISSHIRKNDRAWLDEIAPSSKKLMKILGYLNKDSIPALVSNQERNLRHAREDKKLINQNIESIKKNEPINVVYSGNMIQLQQSALLAEGLFNLATADLKHTGYTDAVKHYLLQTPETATHLVGSRFHDAHKVTVLIERISYKNSKPILVPTAAAHISLDQVDTLDDIQIQEVLQEHKVTYSNSGTDHKDNIYIIANRKFRHESFLVKSRLLQKAFKHIFDVNEAQIADSQKGSPIKTTSLYFDAPPYVSHKTYALAHAATYPPKDYPMTRIERLNKADQRPSQEVIPNPEDSLPKPEEINDKIIKPRQIHHRFLVR